KARIWETDVDDKGTKWNDVEIPAEFADQAEEYRGKLIEAIADTDEELLDKYLGDEESSEAEIVAALRKGTISGAFTPVLCGTAFKNKGIQLLLDAVVAYLPSPVDIPPVQGVDVK